jgi:hypothetical protein
MAEIFISYEKTDLAHAEMLADMLERRGWATFWDRTIPAGSTWRKTIGRELDAARCVVVLWSEASKESRWVLEEAEDALGRGVLLPVLIEDGVQPPIGFRSIQAGNLANWDGTELAPVFQKLITDITRLIGPGAGSATKGRARSLQEPSASGAAVMTLGITEGGKKAKNPQRASADPQVVPQPAASRKNGMSLLDVIEAGSRLCLILFSNFISSVFALVLFAITSSSSLWEGAAITFGIVVLATAWTALSHPARVANGLGRFTTQTDLEWLISHVIILPALWCFVPNATISSVVVFGLIYFPANYLSNYIARLKLHRSRFTQHAS